MSEVAMVSAALSGVFMALLERDDAERARRQSRQEGIGAAPHDPAEAAVNLEFDVPWIYRSRHPLFIGLTLNV